MEKAILNKFKINIFEYLPLRKRYVLNRDGGLRLRYSVLPFLALASFSLSLIDFSNPEVTDYYSSEFSSLNVESIEDDIAMYASSLNDVEPAGGAVPQENIISAVATLDDKVDILSKLKTEKPELKSDELIANALDRHRDVEGNIRRMNADVILASAKTGMVIKKDLKKNLKIGKGDTVAGVLLRSGIESGDAYRAVKAMGKYLNPTKVKPGQMLSVNYKKENGDIDFIDMTVFIDKVSSIIITKDKYGDFSSKLEEKKLEQKFYAKKTVVKNSLYGSAEKAGIPSSIVANAIRAYSWDVDFQRDLRSGDVLEVLYDQMVTEDGEVAKKGNIIFAKLKILGTELPIYRFKDKNGKFDYYDERGQSIKKALMKTPVDGGRISSNYGMRRHPVLGYNKLHKGTDFAAPTGTKIFAAGDGVIERASRNGGYGNYIKIRHNSQLKTAYAHLHKYAKGIRSGVRVKQGQLIGYVGTTGRSTGPHLHFEVLVNNKQVDARRVDLPMGEILKGKELARFLNHKNDLDLRYAELSGTLEYVEAPETPPYTR